MSPTCVQQPPLNAIYRPSTPPTPSPGPSGGLALHAVWDGCTIWGAGISADLNRDEPSDGAGGTKQPAQNSEDVERLLQRGRNEPIH